MNIEKEQKLEELIEDLKIQKSHTNKIMLLCKQKIEMIDFIISELEDVLTKD